MTEEVKRFQVIVTGPFADSLREEFDRMLASDGMAYLRDHSGCARYVLSLGVQRVREELERDA
jgi:hypothetical protein